MINVVIKNKTAAEVMEIVRALRDEGYVQGVDFDFAYKHAQYDNDSWQETHPKQTVFSFHTEKYATLFAIKYST